LASSKIGTMEEFARAVGLSRPTVSKYFQDPASVRPKTRGKIEAALQKHGFRPNIFAVNLNRRRSKIIGLIVPDPTDPFYMTLAQRVETEATEAGYLALVLSSNGRPEIEARAIETITALNVAGALIAPLGEASDAAKLKALSREFPLIYVDAMLDEEGPFVGTDNHQTIPLITEYLCRFGEPPCYLDMPKTNTNSRDRRSAYVATMERLGMEPRFAGMPPATDWDFEKVAFEETGRILREGGFPSRTILCPNDRMAFGVLAAMYAAGIKVGFEPDCQYRVAGHDNQRFSAYTCPPLTTVSQDCDEMGRVAVRMLLDNIANEDLAGENRQVLLSGALVLRKSA
jgi:DNA-binding LacI/PurR family transcriptional regulator